MLTKATSDPLDQLYAWGSTKDGVLGLGPGIAENDVLATPSKVELPTVTIEQVSIGDGHAAVLTSDQRLFMWGSNKSGELGLDDTETRWEPVLHPSLASHVGCGSAFTFLITEQNEIMIAGKLPFSVVNEQGEEQDFIEKFQTVAQFDSRVNITQVEVSRFASIVVDPVVDGSAKELFLWGQSPLGIFNELTPVSQLFDTNQSFNVKAVRNGRNFCIFVD